MTLKERLAKQGNQSICPTAALMRRNYILQGLRNYTPDKWKAISVWTTPGGRCDPGETIEVTLRREVREEVGIIDFEIADFIAEIPGAKEGDVILIFFCKTRQDFRIMEPEKFSEWKWVPLEEYFAGEPYSVMNPTAHKLISEFLIKRFSYGD